MKIREMRKSDKPFLLSFRDTFTDMWNGDMLDSAFRAGNFYGFIAEEKSDGAPTGFITYSVNTDTADLQDLFVAEDFRRRGIGKTLVSAFIDAAREKGVKKLFLEVRESNAAAKNLYKSCGFTEISVRKKYYADGENALAMVKGL